MKTNHEIEYKTLIDETLYFSLCSAFTKATIHNQTNVYYESETVSLKAMGFAIRIREIDGKHLFTMKQKADKGHREYEVYLGENSPEALNHPELKQLFDSFGITGPFIKIGELHTIRRSIPLQYGELCLDENEYCGIKDYEIEFEIDINHPDEANQEFFHLMDQFHINYQQAMPKRTRCINQLNKEKAQ